MKGKAAEDLASTCLHGSHVEIMGLGHVRIRVTYYYSWPNSILSMPCFSGPLGNFKLHVWLIGPWVGSLLPECLDFGLMGSGLFPRLT
jgi:hypothetical protein